MKQCLKYVANIIILLTCVSVLAGCFDRRELDTLGIVMGVAIDKAETEGDSELTVQMASPVGASSEKSKSKTSKGGGDTGGSSAYINVSNTGKNMNYIIREMQHKMSRRIYVAHSQVIVIGEEMAKNGVRDCLDFFARAPEARMTLYVLISKGKARDVLDIQPEFEKLPSVELSKILDDQTITSHTPIVTEFEFASALVSKTTAAVAPIVRIIEEEEKQRPSVSGAAVFKESKMVGELDMDETRGMLFVKGKVKTGVFLLNIMNTTSTLEIREAHTKVKPILYSDGTMMFNVEVTTTVGLGDQSGTDNLSDPDNTAAMLSAIETAVKGEIMSAVEKSKELNADVFGFGEYINRKYPDQWKQMKGKWDELYRNIKVNVTVKAKADGSGRIVKPLTPDEG